MGVRNLFESDGSLVRLVRRGLPTRHILIKQLTGLLQ
jgi:hypothetical protein